MTRFIATTAVLFGVVTIGFTVYANRHASSFAVRHSDEGTPLLIDENNTAIHGYDVVNYFTEGQPAKGSDRLTSEYQGATWNFVSVENQRAFEADPQRYVPAYGGYCAWGVAEKNDLFDGDPTAWKIVDGTLYLNVNRDIQQKWVTDIPGFIRAADNHWTGLKEQSSKS